MARLFGVWLLALGHLGASRAGGGRSSGRWWDAAPLQYNETLAKQLLVYSSIAIAEPEEVEAWAFRNPECNERTVDDQLYSTYRTRDTAFGFIVVNHVYPYILASFKASNDTRDWIEHDFRTLPFAYRERCTIENVTLPGHVHAGFCSYYRELAGVGMSDDLAGLHGLLGYPVVLTGHSLGAAAAVVCAADLRSRFGLQPLLYTFGQPRVGDYEFSAAIAETKRAFRVVHFRDIVPHLAVCCGPDCSPDPTCPYQHGPEIWYRNDMALDDRYLTCNQGESPDCSNGVVHLSTEDHDIYFGVYVAYGCSSSSPDPLTRRAGPAGAREGREAALAFK